MNNLYKQTDTDFMNIVILYKSFIFSWIISHISNHIYKTEQERYIYIFEMTVLIYCLCKMEVSNYENKL